MNLWTKVKSLFSSAPMRHEQAAGGYNSNPFYQTNNFWSNLFGRFAGTRVDYAREAGELTQNRLIMAAVNFLGRSLPEAPIEIAKLKSDGTTKKVLDHPVLTLIRRPNKYYTTDLLLKALGLSWTIAGNVYLYKVRNHANEVMELWYLPHFAIEPRWTGNNFIDYYAYNVDGIEYKIAPSDIIHLRNGIDPNNTRLGLSDVAAALREIYTDNEAANFSALLMKNSGVPPFVISPKKDQVNLDDKQRERISNSFQRKITGDERGKPVVNSVAVEITKTGFSPEEMDLTKLRRLPEETIASLTGIPAVVLQFGAGLERSTYSNYKEAKESAYEGVVVPLWRYIAAELTHHLLNDFDKSEKLTVSFDLSKVRVLQDDQQKLFARVTMAYRGGVMKRSEARSELGLQTETEDEVYFVQPKIEEKPKDEKVTKKVN